MEQRQNYPPREWILKNKMGNEIQVILRTYRPGDEQGMIACIRDEYGDTYFKTGFYNPKYLAKEVQEGVMTFLIAEMKNEGIIGMLLLKKFYPTESMCEIASQIFKKQYRGYGLAEPLFSYGMEILKSCVYSAAFCLPVMFHDVTQRLLYRQGLRGTGFFLNVFDMGQIVHSYDNRRNTKHSQGIQIMALEKTNAGRLYIPKEHQEFCKVIYDRLGVNYQIVESEVPMPDKSKITWESDVNQSSLEIRVHEVGRNLYNFMNQMHIHYPLIGKQTANVLLNINDPNAIRAYTILKWMGYFFTGLKPLCSEREYMVLHHCGEIKVWFEDYAVSEEFRELLEYVEKMRKER